MTQCQIIDKDFLLLGRTGQLVKCNMQSLLITVYRSQRDVGFHLRFEAVTLFQSQWHGRIIDFSKWRHIVIGYPTPKIEL